jgi:hypothetical protein
MIPTEYHFVVSRWSKWVSLLGHSPPRFESLASHIVNNEDVWIVQTYLQLASRGFRATIGPAGRSDAINIADGISLQLNALSQDDFYVGCRSDGHFPGICQVVIQQNDLLLESRPAIYIPQWPQPAIIPRDPSRRGISRLGFFGHVSINLSPEFRCDAFQQSLHQLGCQLVLRGRAATEVNWSDYSTIDLVLSVRTIPPSHLMLKPVNKLSNAWLAQVPALIGSEPAIKSIRRDPLDYIEIRQPADALFAVQELRENPSLYRQMVEHGMKRAAEYGPDAVAARWVSQLEGLRSAFNEWQRLSRSAKAADFQRRIDLNSDCMGQHAASVHSAYAALGYGPEWWSTRDSDSHPAIGIGGN